MRVSVSRGGGEAGLISHWELSQNAETLGSNLVTNGTFDSDTGWGKGTGWTISGGKANVSSTSSAALTQAVVQNGKKYRLKFDISNYVNGKIQPQISTQVISTAATPNGSYEYEFICTRGTTLYLYAVNTTNLSIDNVVIEEIVTADTSGQNHGSIVNGPTYTMGPTARDLGPERLTNAGSGSQTDWVDTNSDGVPDDWNHTVTTGTPSIVTGNGFTGNAARRVSGATASYIGTGSNQMVQSGKTYRLSLKYRCSGTIQSGTGTYSFGTIPTNTGNATTYTTTFTATGTWYLQFYIGGNSTDWAEIDEISLREVVSPNAMNFDGVDDYVSITNNEVLNPTSAITLSAWIKPFDITTNTYYEIIRQDPNASNRKLFSFQDNGTKLTLGLQTGGAYWETDTPITASEFTDGNWHHVVALYDSESSKARVYKDGVLLEEENHSGIISSTSAPFFIGSVHGSSEFFNGSISDVRIYDRALSATEVLNLYEGSESKMSVGNLNKGLVGHWPLTSESKTTNGNLAANGGFDSDTIWGKQAGWTISGGVATCDGSQAARTFINQDVGLQSDTKYRISFDLTVTGGFFSIGDSNIYLVGNGSSGLTTSGHYDVEVTTGSSLANSNIHLHGFSNFAGTVDNFVITKALAGDQVGANHGTQYKDVDIRNQGYEFNGDGGYIDAGVYDYTAGDKFSVSFWAKSGTQSIYGGVVTQASSGIGNTMISSTGFLYWDEGGNGNCSDSTKTIWSNHKWHHGTITYNGTNVSLYVDGVFIKTCAVATNNDNANVSIGRYSGVYPFDGNIADVRIYDRTLSASEVLQLANGKNIPSPVRHYPLASGAGDISGNGNHGTVSGATLIGESASFDGADDRISVPNDPRWDFGTGDFMTSFWFKTSKTTREHALNIGGAAGAGNISFDFNDGINKVWVYWMGGGSPNVQTTTNYSDGVWHHLVFQRNGTTAELFLDGTRVDTQTDSTDIDISGALQIGAVDSSYPWDGEIKDIRIYNRALSATEITSLYSQGHAKQKQLSTGNLNKGLVGYWPLKSEYEVVSDNLLTNPGFETGDMTSWTNGSGDYSVINDSVKSGSYALKGVHDGSLEKPLAGQSIPVEVGKQYVVSAWIKSDLTAGTHYLTTENAFHGTIERSISGTTDWTFVQKIGTATTTTLNVYVYPHSYPNGTTWTDNISVKEINLTADLTSNDNHGSVYGATVGADYTSFDGVNDYIDVGDISNTVPEIRSGMVRFYASSPISKTTPYSPLLNFGTTATAFLHLGALTGSITDEIIVLGGWGTNCSYWASSTESIPVGWHVLAWSWDGNKNQLYLDGVALTTETKATPTVISPVNFKISTFYDGYDYSNLSISDVRIYDRSLSPLEVKMLYDQGH